MRHAILSSILVVTLTACGREEPENTQATQPDVQSAPEVSVPTGTKPTLQALERERFSQEWRQLRSFMEAKTIARTGEDQRDLSLTFVSDPGSRENLDTFNPSTIETLPIRVPIRGDVSGPSVLKAQVLLDRISYSVGVIDGRWGKNSEIAVYWFQQQHGITPSGTIDEETFRAIARAAGGTSAVVRQQLTPDDVKGPFIDIPENVYAQARLECMCYESVAEKVAERFHTTPELLQILNPDLDLGRLAAGQMILAPNVRAPAAENAPNDIARIAISIKGNYFHGHDASGRIIFHAPTTLGSKYDPSPTETLKTVRTAFNPTFKYQPTLFAEVPDDEPEADLPPGPNSPVGVVWIALSKPHYGIHGTSDPESIGYASSHGCVRLTNWDATDVARRTPEGTTVQFFDTRH